MKLMEDLILAQGEILPGDILKIDSILNHKFHPEHMDKFGEEFARLFEDIEVDLILTAEVSGIPLAYATARNIGVPVVYARKRKPVTMRGNIIVQPAYSPTKGEEVNLMVSQYYIHQNDNVLVIDDFLASSVTALALARIICGSSCRLWICS